MTDEQIKNLNAHIQIKVGRECPACGQDTVGEWTHLEEIINEDGEQPLVGVFCPNCSNTLLFPARYVGIGL